MSIDRLIELAKTESRNNIGIPKKEIWRQIAECLTELKQYRNGFTKARNRDYETAYEKGKRDGYEEALKDIIEDFEGYEAFANTGIKRKKESYASKVLEDVKITVGRLRRRKAMICSCENKVRCDNCKENKKKRL